MDAVDRHRVGVRGPQRDPRHHGGDHRDRQRRQHERQGERPQQHLEREQRAAQRHVVDRRKAGAGAARRRAAAVARSAAAPTRPAGWRWRRPASCGAASRPSETPIPTATIDRTPRSRLGRSRRRPLRSQSASDTSVAPAPEPLRRAMPAAPTIAAASSSTTMRRRSEADTDVGEEGPVPGAEGESLDETQERHQSGCADPGDHADRADQPPEAKAVARPRSRGRGCWAGGRTTAESARRAPPVSLWVHAERGERLPAEEPRSRGRRRRGPDAAGRAAAGRATRARSGARPESCRA